MKNAKFADMQSIAQTISIVFLALFSVAFLWQHNWLLFLFLAVLVILLLGKKGSKRELKTFFFCGTFGILAETLAIHGGAWAYQNPNLFYVPAWLFIL